MSIRKYYLAHSFSDKGWVRSWQLSQEQLFKGIKFTNPFYENDAENDGDYIKIVENDLKLIDKSHGLVAMVTDQHRVGTFMEIFYAARNGKPVYIYCNNKRLENHPWLVYHAKVYTDLEELKNEL